MPIVLSDVTFAYPRATKPLIHNLSLTFTIGWTCLLGDNGCGKTTLVKLAAGLLEPQQGTIQRLDYVAWCPQDPQQAPEALLDFACAYDPLARSLRSRLALQDDMPWRFAQLSCGEQKKLQVAVALWQQPDALILDEPTNHIDHQARRQLLEVLQQFKGTGILVSHDRQLLGLLGNRCACFEQGRVILRPGNYSVVRAQMELERRSAAHERQSATRELNRLAAEKLRRSHQAAAAASKRSKRGLDPKDHDGRARIGLAIVSGQDGAAGRRSSAMDARLKRAQERKAAAQVSKRYDGNLWVEMEVHPRPVLLRCGATSIACGEDELAVPDLYVGHRDHVGMVGPNGSGKSTLVRWLLTQAPQDVRVLYVPQEVDEEGTRKLLERLAELSAAERGQVLSVVAQLNSEPERILEGGSLSPGEARKLIIALGMLEKPQLLVLDEPTNHLDLHSVEALERALADFPGALLAVSHDYAFLDACCEMRWRVEGGAVRVKA